MRALTRFQKLVSVTTPADVVGVWLRHGRAEARQEWDVSARLRRRGLPRVRVESVLSPPSGELRLRDVDAYASQDVFAMAALAAIAASERPKKVLEIGTFRGATAWLFAANAPEATVYTLDLPAGSPDAPLPRTGVDAEIIAARGGRRVYEGTPEASRIVPLVGDSVTFDFDAVGCDIDLAFIDGAHSHEYVRNDTEAIVPRMRPGGLVIWDDYSDLFPGVVGYLNGWRDRGAAAVAATDLVLWRVPGAASPAGDLKE